MVYSSIIDNSDGNLLIDGLGKISQNCTHFDIASAFFSLDALGMLAEKLQHAEKIRLLFGDDAAKSDRRKLLAALRERSDADLAGQRTEDITLTGLHRAFDLIRAGKFEARCYTRKKFHAKAYIAHVPHHPGLNSVMGSGNFTRYGLTQNIELNAHMGIEQTKELRDWFEEHWQQAEQDVVTEDILSEISRQIDLYDPYAIYQKALLAWGNFYQGGINAEETLQIREKLDAHQELGYRRALEVLNRENGVMICDGVGLGKSFIALALMEHYCREKKNVLLIAPKSIMESSWNTYLENFLSRYRQPFGTIHEKLMTDLAIDLDEEPTSDRVARKQEEIARLAERADVIVIDESHNFRTTNAQRYINLYSIVQSASQTPDKRKKVILLTATPVNTAYHDLSAQIALVTHESGSVAGYEIGQIREATRELDNQRDDSQPIQLTLDYASDASVAAQRLDEVLESLIIQRKRKTCVELAEAQGKVLLFPNREKPQVISYELSPSFSEVVILAEKRFSPIAALLRKIRNEYDKARASGIDFKPPKMPAKTDGIKFAAFLPEQYRIGGGVSKRSYQVEVTLASLVFTNTLKQLESSPPAFQGILQSLGLGLITRLKYVCGEQANADIEPHYGWIRTPLHAIETDKTGVDVEGGELADVNGTELDEWLEKAITSRHLYHKLADFNDQTYDVPRWRRDILNDLAYLKEIHAITLEARQFQDYKLEAIKKKIEPRLEARQRILVFTQSQRTAFYLEKQLSEAFPHHGVARIDSNVKQETRADILYAFCPLYNPQPRLINRERVDILICTDVLSEGVNMQEAQCILNYDIHWNPVRLIQRIGRVDRRLDPAKNPVPHTFSILNCLPPDQINDIIKLVNTVERRRTIIDRTLGIDASFFKATDPEGTLREFNHEIDGVPSAIDRANERYVRALAAPDPALAAVLAILPPGAFGVWDYAPVEGLFALFEMRGTDSLTNTDADRFRSIIGRPVLVLKSGGRILHDAGDILELLSGTVKGQKSADPGDTEELKRSLTQLKTWVNNSFRNINLPAAIQPRLICSLELRTP
jgi:superfamily II DNA or RNA helicase/HKD family nuclease